MPKGGYGGDVADQVAIYGFRSLQPDLFFLSPWEFCQWDVPHRLREPGPKYNWTKFTAAGRQRLDLEKGQKIKMAARSGFRTQRRSLGSAVALFPVASMEGLFRKKQ